MLFPFIIRVALVNQLVNQSNCPFLLSSIAVYVYFPLGSSHLLIPIVPLPLYCLQCWGHTSVALMLIHFTEMLAILCQFVPLELPKNMLIRIQALGSYIFVVGVFSKTHTP